MKVKIVAYPDLGYTNSNGKIDLSDYERVEELTNGLTSAVWLWKHKRNTDTTGSPLKIVVKTPKLEANKEVVRHNIKSINAFFDGNSAWSIEGDDDESQFAMKYYEGSKLSQKENEDLVLESPSPIATFRRNGWHFTMLDVNADNFLKLSDGRIIPVGHDYMLMHKDDDGEELLSHQTRYIEERYDNLSRRHYNFEWAGPEEDRNSKAKACRDILASHPKVARYLYKKWVKAKLTEIETEYAKVPPQDKNRYSDCPVEPIDFEVLLKPLDSQTKVVNIVNSEAVDQLIDKAPNASNPPTISFSTPPNLTIQISPELKSNLDQFTALLNQENDRSKANSVASATQMLIDGVLEQFTAAKPFDNNAFKKLVKTYEETVTHLSLQQKLFIGAMTFLGVLIGFVVGAAAGAAMSGLNPIAALAAGTTGAVVGACTVAAAAGAISFYLARFGVFNHDPVKKEAINLLSVVRSSVPTGS